MLQRKGVRSNRLVAWLAVIGGIAGVAVACVELKGSLGSDCLKNEDCQSGVCTQLKCAEQGPLLELEAGPDAATDANADAPPSTTMDAPAKPIDGTSPGDSPSTTDVQVLPDGTTAPDAAADVLEEGPTPDAPSDAPSDTAVNDAREDAGESG